ncbi:MAG: glucose-1-phosphate cytidylyltransferase [Magnetococcales bacterium]|nr:glucose-1-phosphate cytidylyltransferase [Magnetococcales bacterium]
MQVVILCGGYGTRLREETEFRPKPMVMVGGRPILWHIMKMYAAHGFKRFILCLGYKGEMIKEYFLNYEAMNRDFTITLGERHRIQLHGAHDEEDFQVTLAETGHDAMTGGRIKAIEPYIDGEDFMVTYGDGLSDVPLATLADFHRRHGGVATVTAVSPVSRFGVLELEEGGRVARFQEKPKVHGVVSAGFFVFNRKIFDYLDGGPAQVLEQEPLMRLADEGKLHAFRHEGFFYAMDTYREYQQLQKMWSSGEAPWKVW